MRNDVAAAELRPVAHTTGVPSSEAVAGAARLPRLDAARLRRDVDAVLDHRGEA